MRREGDEGDQGRDGKTVLRDVKKTGEEEDWQKKTRDREGWKRPSDEAVKKLRAAPHSYGPDKGEKKRNLEIWQ